MMREWSAARQRVQDLRISDPAGAERLNRDITNVREIDLFTIVYSMRFIGQQNVVQQKIP